MCFVCVCLCVCVCRVVSCSARDVSCRSCLDDAVQSHKGNALEIAKSDNLGLHQEELLLQNMLLLLLLLLLQHLLLLLLLLNFELLHFALLLLWRPQRLWCIVMNVVRAKSLLVFGRAERDYSTASSQLTRRCFFHICPLSVQYLSIDEGSNVMHALCVVENKISVLWKVECDERKSSGITSEFIVLDHTFLQTAKLLADGNFAIILEVNVQIILFTGLW